MDASHSSELNLAVAQSKNHVNELKAYFGFIPQNPLDVFFVHPCGELLSNISKSQQTTEMVMLALKEENEKCCHPILRYVSKKLMTDEVCDIAISSNIANFFYVPNSFKTPERCLAAVQKKAPRFNDAPLLSAVPEKVLMGSYGKEICETAVAADWRSIKYVPKQHITSALLEKAVDGIAQGEYIYDICDYFPQHKITKDMALEIMRKSGQGYLSLPPRFRKDKDIIDMAVASHPSVVFDVSPKILTDEMFYKAVQSDESLLMQLPEYFSLRFNLPAKDEFVGTQAEDMVDGVLLVGGDVADSEEVAKIFFDTVFFRFRGPIIFVLGNHELWDGCTYANGESCRKRSIDEVVAAYKRFYKVGSGFEGKTYCLENEVLVCYKNSMQRNSDEFGVGRKTAGMPRGGLCVLTEEMLLNTSTDDLREFFDECSMLVLGGLGFCGLNPRYNADTGLFRDRVSREEDIERSKRFRAVYDKVMSCASDKRVVVLTHTQIEDWTTDAPNKGWVYVNGHTHQNGLVKTDDGVAVLYDNQVGYKPKKWHLNQFSLERYYDPFEAWADGIYQITPQQYMDFNAGRGIQMEYFRQQGDIYALKQKGIYMFMLQYSIGLYLLRGGQKLNVFHGLEYYAANLEKYVEKIQAAFRPYRNALDKIAAEVKRFGGSGYVHGSIVDIDFYNHIYLDPFDGYLMPYFAFDVTGRREFRSVQELLESSPIPALGSDGKPLMSAYTKLLDAGGVSILAPTVKEDALAVVPMEVLDEKNIYAPSRIMKSIQYLLDKGVVRVWNDAVLSMPDRSALPDAKPELHEANE